MMIGEDVEDYEIIVPVMAFEMIGYTVDSISHGKKENQTVRTTVAQDEDLIFDIQKGEKEEPREDGKKKPKGHLYKLNQSFDTVLESMIYE